MNTPSGPPCRRAAFAAFAFLFVASPIPAVPIVTSQFAVQEGFDSARLELPVRRATEGYTGDPPEENAFKLINAVARVEQWMCTQPHEHQRTQDHRAHHDQSQMTPPGAPPIMESQS